MCKRILLSNILETIRTVIFRSSIKTVFLAFIISIQLVTKVNGQNYPDPNVSFNVVNIPLSRVLKILEQKTNYTFSYLNEKLPLDENVTMNVKDKPLQQILKILSNNFALMFTRINNIITIKMKEEAEGDKKSGGIGTLRGIVRDSITTEVLPFANVYIPELKTGVSTDNRGFFIIPSIPANKEYTLVVTFVGYSPKKITLSIQANKIT
ncbi:carboxypeptidase-like regulatory domain-containing protein, partial [bacterium BMS3Abin03]|nr:carboxypeptidase-like regulatory domain-containing protein [bacterium BMS3Abin03]